MKKSLLALAVLGTFAGMAAAQSTVTLFGIVDVSGQSFKNGTNKQKRMGTDGINSSRLGFRGVEDLGGGLSAGFWLEAGLAADGGTVGGGNGNYNANAAATGAVAGSPGAFFNRRSTISLIGGFGEIRLGRDYTPAFWNTTVFDPFGTNGVGQYTNLSINGLGTAGSNVYVRANNTIGYFLPGNLGGLYGQVQVSSRDGTAAAQTPNKQQSGRIGFAAGPVNVAASYGVSKDLPTDWKHTNIAGSWNFGFMTLMAQFDNQKAGSLKQDTPLIGVVVPLGQGELHASFVKADQKGGTTAFNDADAKQVAVGYVYNLSKRTALYGTYAQIKNEGTRALSISGSQGGTPAGGKSTGFEVGARHAF